MALAGQHDCSDILSGGLLDRFAQSVDEFAVQGVAPLGALHLQGHHVAVAGHTNHAPSPISLVL